MKDGNTVQGNTVQGNTALIHSGCSQGWADMLSSSIETKLDGAGKLGGAELVVVSFEMVRVAL